MVAARKIHLVLFISICALSLLACSRDLTRSQTAARLSQWSSPADSLVLRSLITADHRSVRMYLDSLLRSLLVDSLRQESNAIDWIEPRTVSLVKQYEDLTQIHDLSHRLRWLQSASSACLSQKLCLDSLSRVGAVGAGHAGFKPSAIAATSLSTEYLKIGDTATAASLQLRLAVALRDSMTVDRTLALIAETERLCRCWDLGEVLGDLLFLRAKIRSEKVGDYFKSLSDSYDALACFVRFGYRDRVPLMQLQLGYSLNQLGLTLQALQEFREAASQYSTRGDKKGIANAYYYLAESYFDLAQIDSSRSYATKSLLLRQQLAAVNSDNVIIELAFARSTCGIIDHAMKSPAIAEAELLTAQRLFQAAHDKDGLATNFLRRAAVHVDLKNYAVADRLLDSALALTEDFQEQLFAKYGKALVAYLRQDYALAQRTASECIAKLETTRNLVLQPNLAVGFLSDKLGVYNLLVRIYLDRYRESHEPAYLDSALQLLEASKARSLLDVLRTKRAQASVDGQAALFRQGRREHVGHDMLVTGSATRFAYDDSLRLTQPGQGYAPTEGTSADALMGLPARTQGFPRTSRNAILNYSLSEFGTGVFVSIDQRTQYVAFDVKVDSIESLRSSLVAAISEYPASGKPTDVQVETAAELCRILIPTQLLDDNEVRALTIIPMQPISDLPFAALMTAESEFLVEKYELSLAPSSAVLRELTEGRELRTCGNEILVVGDPQISSALSQNVAVYFHGVKRLHSLNFARAEAQSIQSSLSGQHVSVALGLDARESLLKSRSLSPYGTLHFATHGLMNSANPEFSALMLTPENEVGQDGLLLAAEIAELHLSGQSIFLSACETAAGFQYRGEGVFSLARAFLAAGAGEVVATLWRVDDRSTVELTADYYKHIRSGETPSAALASAQRAMIKSSRRLYQHPYFWSPFVHVGGTAGSAP